MPYVLHYAYLLRPAGYMKHFIIHFLLPEIQRCVTSHGEPTVTMFLHGLVHKRRRCAMGNVGRVGRLQVGGSEQPVSTRSWGGTFTSIINRRTASICYVMEDSL